jgi:hypothetical protein
VGIDFATFGAQALQFMLKKNRFCYKRNFFATLIHYGSKSEILGGNRFCCKRTIFSTLVHYGSKSGILGGNRFRYKRNIFLLFGTL